MRLALDMSLSYVDPQPRDGGAPNPSAATSRLSLSKLVSMAGDGPQPRDGG